MAMRHPTYLFLRARVSVSKGLEWNSPCLTPDCQGRIRRVQLMDAGKVFSRHK